MRTQPYSTEELKIAYSYDVYLRWQAWKRRQHAEDLPVATVQDISEKLNFRPELVNESETLSCFS